MVSACDEGLESGQGSEGNAATLPLEQPGTRAYLGATVLGIGTLRIAPDLMSWKDDATETGFSLRYENISLHAIRREPFPSLYMMIDINLDLPEGLIRPEDASVQQAEESDDEIECDEQPSTELMFAPEDPEVIPRLFEAMSECQTLHPDPNDSISEEDDDIYEDASSVMDENDFDPNQADDNGEEMVEEHMEGLHIGNANNGNMEYDPEQFADD